MLLIEHFANTLISCFGFSAFLLIREVHSSKDEVIDARTGRRIP